MMVAMSFLRPCSKTWSPRFILAVIEGLQRFPLLLPRTTIDVIRAGKVIIALAFRHDDNAQLSVISGTSSKPPHNGQGLDPQMGFWDKQLRR
jgi:hypothetical protein